MTSPVQKTLVRRQEQYRDRWSYQEQNSGILSVSELLTPGDLRKFELLAEFDDKMLLKLAPDLAVVTWKRGAVLFEEGSYLDLAFFVLHGEVEMFLQKQEADAQEAPIFDEDRTVFGGARPQAGSAPARSLLRSQIDKQSPRPAEITFLSVMDFDLPAGQRAVLGPGELFGEIGAMSGWPQSVTARTVSECTLLQIRVPALRLLRRRSKTLRERLDALYRKRSLGSQIKSTPLFRNLSEDAAHKLIGGSDLVSCDPGEIVVREGDSAGAVYMVRSGFVKLTQQVGGGSMAVTYLSKGMTFGEVELLSPDIETWTATASSVEYGELVRFDPGIVRELLQGSPPLEQAMWTTSIARLKEIGNARRDLPGSEFLNSALETGLVQGNSILVIDLDRCTRCDDCVKGCTETHDGLPRFIREGNKYRNLLVAKSCYHCRDPVCLIGCPTGAIRRAGVDAVVEISQSLCIGCSACANNCPYDAIVMQETGDVWPENALPESLRGKPRKFASKCDLCHTSDQGPACVRNCPNECAYRVGSIEEFRNLLSEE